eukprot:scaffold149_cov315-Pinguiococcus_pyrenoidosus.AAC.83
MALQRLSHRKDFKRDKSQEKVTSELSVVMRSFAQHSDAATASQLSWPAKSSTASRHSASEAADESRRSSRACAEALVASETAGRFRRLCNARLLRLRSIIPEEY